MASRYINHLLEKVKMLEEKMKMLVEKVKMLEGDKDKDKKPERYTIATPATPSVAEGSDTSEDKDIGTIYDLVEPKSLDVTIYVISLDTVEGNKRKNQLNFPHVKFKGYDHESTEPDIIKMKGRGQEVTTTAPRQRATFYSHMKVWQKIASEQRSAVVCEDDAIMLEGRSFNTSSLQQDGITLLGGCIRTPGAWAREKSEFAENLKFLEIVKNFKSGTNIITNEFRWTNCLGYYIPLNLAKEFIQTASDCLGKVRPVDIWLGQQSQMKYIYYPNVSVDMDNATTQVNSPKGHQKADFYICEFMRKAAMKQGINLSSRGLRTLLAE